MEIANGWLMRDAARVTQTGEVISTVGFAPRVYTIKPYVSPATAGANPAAATREFDDNFPNGDWAEHCLVSGNGHASLAVRMFGTPRTG